MGIINGVLKPSLVQGHFQLWLYRILAWPVLCCGSKTWTRKQDINRTLHVKWNSYEEQVVIPYGITKEMRKS